MPSGFVTPQSPGGGSQTLEEVLTAGADGGGVGMANTGAISTGGGGIDVGGGGLTNTDSIDTGGANITSSGGDFDSGGGDVDTGGGSLVNAQDVVIKTGEVFRVVAAGGSASFQVAQAGGGIGFNNTAPIASVPILPAVVTAQDIADALVAYGLVLQDAP